MLGLDTNVSSTDLSHAGALLIGLGVGVWLTLRVVRDVFNLHHEDEEHHRQHGKEDED